MEAETKQATQGWLDTIKNQFEGITQQFELSWAKVTEYGIAFGGGMLVGFLVKRYGRQTILTILAFAAVLAGLNYFELVTIDWIKVKEFIGLAPAETVEAFFKDYWQWATSHIISVVVSILGFIVGYKVG